MIKKYSIIVACFLAISACSSDDNDSTSAPTGSTDSDSNNSPAATLARNFVNNGFYLSSTEEFGADGRSFGGTTYTLNTDENIIEARSLENESIVETIFRYNASGDIASVSALSTSELLAPVGDEILRSDIEYIDGALHEINVENLVGVEEDYQSIFSYNTDGTISSVNTIRLDTNRTEQSTFNYEEGLLTTITGNETELPSLTFISTISRDNEGRVGTVQTVYESSTNTSIGPMNIVYLYDENGNISERQYLSEDGNLNIRDVFTYLPTTENVFNLNNYDIYFFH